MHKWIRRSISFCLVLVSMLAGATTAMAESKIGVVDLDRIFRESKVGKAGLAEIKAFQEARQQAISEEEQRLLQMRKEFEARIFTLTEDAKKLERDRISQSEIDLKRMLEDAERELRKRQSELLQRIQKDLLTVIADFGKDKKFDFILQKDVFLYVDDSQDVTKDIIARYDRSSKP